MAGVQVFCERLALMVSRTPAIPGVSRKNGSKLTGRKCLLRQRAQRRCKANSIRDTVLLVQAESKVSYAYLLVRNKCNVTFARMMRSRFEIKLE